MKEQTVLYINMGGVAASIIFSAFFSGSETALTALPDSKAHQLAVKYPMFAGFLKKWQTKPSLILSTILFGNTLANIVGAILMGKIAAHYLHNYADAAAVGIMTFLLLIFGEIVPKTYAKLNLDKVIVFVLTGLRVIDFILTPISLLLSRFARSLVHVMGGKNTGNGNDITEQDIEYIIEKGHSLGVFEQQDQGELLNSVLEFKETQVIDIMIPRTDVHFLSIHTSIEEALEKSAQWGHSRIPVYEENVDNIKGIFFVKSLVSLLKEGEVDLSDTIEGMYRHNVLFVPESQKISETLKTMQVRRIHMGIVVDEFGGTAGIITLEDILEELVGDIQDEVDEEDDSVTKLENGNYSVDARISIYDLEEETGISLPDNGDYTSLGGFILESAGQVPRSGYSMEYRGYRFIVTESDERHVIRVEIVPPDGPDELYDDEK